MKLISIEDRVYRISNKDYKEFNEKVSKSLLNYKIEFYNFLSKLEDKYKPILILNSSYNY